MRKWLPLVAVCLGTFMLLVDVTIVNVALPDMAGDLATSFSALQWVVNGYALSLAALLLGAGAVADRLGHRRTFVAGLAAFALASLACGVAPAPLPLIAARVAQGVGGAAMIATTFALLNNSYSGRERGIAYGIWGAVSGASSAVGPLLGGPLTEFLSWRWIFFVNLPVSAIAIATSLLVLRDPQARPARRIDVAGVALFSAAIAALAYGMSRAGEAGWGAPSCWAALCAGALVLLAFVAVETRIGEPLLDLALLRNRVFSGVLVAAFLLNFAAYVSLSYTSIWMQSVLRLSPVTAGLVALPMSAAAFVVSAALGRAMHRLRPGRLIGGGLLLIGAGDLLGVALVHAWPAWPALLPAFCVVGIGVGLAAPPLGSAGTAAVPAERGGMAGGAIYTARQVGFAFGIALLGSVFTAAARHTLADRHVASSGTLAHEVAGARSADALRQVPAGSRHVVDEAIHAAAANGIAVQLAVAGLAALAAALIAFVTLRERPTPEPAEAPPEPALAE
ncbi:DHA2 family efflux MFS transporter permease subunit [Dactylosporangium sp. CA-092794]|uniref:DHA2 family efflux MFS transporter permease subunit n=1 Tax=Dactylosporangium sp. CA-092794 TaxID=3239929 RepID=UPI003D89C603